MHDGDCFQQRARAAPPRLGLYNVRNVSATQIARQAAHVSARFSASKTENVGTHKAAARGDRPDSERTQGVVRLSARELGKCASVRIARRRRTDRSRRVARDR